MNGVSIWPKYDGGFTISNGDKAHFGKLDTDTKRKWIIEVLTSPNQWFIFVIKLWSKHVKTPKK